MVPPMSLQAIDGSDESYRYSLHTNEIEITGSIEVPSAFHEAHVTGSGVASLRPISEPNIHM